jgi:SAM-dependent methyltransferase
LVRRTIAGVEYDSRKAMDFYDAYGERESTRFEDGRSSPLSVAIHTHYLRRFVSSGDRVLDAGAGPGRFTMELARLGGRVTVIDVSPVQLELNRQRLVAAGLEDKIESRRQADILDLSAFPDGSFDVVVCYGGPLRQTTYGLARHPCCLQPCPEDLTCGPNQDCNRYWLPQGVEHWSPLSDRDKAKGKELAHRGDHVRCVQDAGRDVHRQPTVWVTVRLGVVHRKRLMSDWC